MNELLDPYCLVSSYLLWFRFGYQFGFLLGIGFPFERARWWHPLKASVEGTFFLSSNRAGVCGLDTNCHVDRQ